MLEFIYAVIMVTTSLELSNGTMSISNFSVSFFVLECILVPILEKLKALIRNKNI